MKPEKVKVTKSEVSILFDDGSSHVAAELESGEADNIIEYIVALLDIKDGSKTRGVFSGTIGVDMELSDWLTAANHWQYAARKNDALYYQEVEGLMPEEYSAKLKAQLKFINGAQGVFEGLAYGN